MAAPFSKFDFILILNFMENELKSKDEMIDTLKKYKQYSQSSETKYGKVGPGRSATPTAPRAAPGGLGVGRGGGEYGVDPLVKLNKLIESHRVVTDSIERRLEEVSMTYKQASDKLAAQATEKQTYDTGNPADQLIHEIRCLVKQLENLKQDSHSVWTRLREGSDREMLVSSTKRRSASVLAKLVADRKKLAAELAARSLAVHGLEEELVETKAKSRALEEKLSRPTSHQKQNRNESMRQRVEEKKSKTEELAKELSRLTLKARILEEQNARLLSKLAETRSKQLQSRQPTSVRQLPQPQQTTFIKNTSEITGGFQTTARSAVFSSSPKDLAPPFRAAFGSEPRGPYTRPATVSSFAPTSVVISTTIQCNCNNPPPPTLKFSQQPLPTSQLNSTALQILQLREAEKSANNPSVQQLQLAPLFNQSQQLAPPPLHHQSITSPSSPSRAAQSEMPRSPSKLDYRLNPPSHVRCSPSREASAKGVNVAVVPATKSIPREFAGSEPPLQYSPDVDGSPSRGNRPPLSGFANWPPLATPVTNTSSSALAQRHALPSLPSRSSRFSPARVLATPSPAGFPTVRAARATPLSSFKPSTTGFS